MKRIGLPAQLKGELNKLIAAGKTAAEISDLLSVEQACIEGYLPKEEKPKAKRVTKNGPDHQ